MPAMCRQIILTQDETGRKLYTQFLRLDPQKLESGLTEKGHTL